MKKVIWSLCVCLALVFIGYVFRVPLLRGVGSFLICEDELRKSDAVFVLSGGAYDRGVYAAQLWREAWAPIVVCTGGNVPTNFKAIGYELKESNITSTFLMNMQLEGVSVEVIPHGTSTKEEVELILLYANAHAMKRVIVLSNKFHTRRIYRTVKKAFEEEDIEVVVAGAASQMYVENEWWKYERGLITVNNEYLKLLYYWLKY